MDSSPQPTPASTVVVDFEFGRNGSFYAAATKRGQVERVWEPPAEFATVHDQIVAELPAESILVGHNLHRFDVPQIAKRAPASPLLQLPRIDTLELSVLAFPRRPYHRLAKGDQLVRDARPKPLSDARATQALLLDALEALRALQPAEAQLLAALLSCVEHPPAVAAGWRWLFQQLSWRWGQPVSADHLRRAWAGRVCPHSAAFEHLQFDLRLALVAAWLRVADHEDGSVLPAWVRHQFPGTPTLIRALRGQRCAQPGCDWCATQLDATAWLRRIFGFEHFRPTPAAPDGRSLQEVLVERGLQGASTFGILPTGGGKSLCFQVPAEARHRLLGQLTLVISPLQSLMKDQVDSLADRIPTARAIYGGLPSVLRPQVFQEIRTGACGLLYLSPEQLRNASVLRLLSSRELGAIVFDEAHCLSQWGHDFRTDYPYVLKVLREMVTAQGAPMPPVFLFTATTQHDATHEILAHVQTYTGTNPVVFDGGSARTNLTYEVRHVPEHDRITVLVDLLEQHLGEGSAIVFCGTRARTEQTATQLTESRFSAKAYHAGLDPDQRRTLQESFLQGRIRVITATNAFGMGVDKDDVRLVAHLDMPSSLEAYLQEAGRAGRDGRPATAVLLWAPGDAEARFRLGALSTLGVDDLRALWRGIRRLPAERRDGTEHRLATPRELLAMDAVRGHFEPGAQADVTRVKAAVNWLERSAVLERRQNVTCVFSGRPKLPSLHACVQRMKALDLPEPEIARRTVVLQALYDAGEEGLDADRIAELCRELAPGMPLGGGLRVLDLLQRLVQTGLVTSGQTFSVFLRIGTADPSRAALERWCRRETRLLERLAESDDFLRHGELLHLEPIAKDLSSEERSCTVSQVSRLLSSWSGLGGRRTTQLAPQFHPLPGQRGRLVLNLGPEVLRRLVTRRHAVASRVLATLLESAEGRGGDVLVATTLERLVEGVVSDLGLSQAQTDAVEAVRGAVAWMDSLHVLTVQNGLAIFRSAMQLDRDETAPALGGPLARDAQRALRQHQRRKVLRVHVMDAWAQRMLSDPEEAEVLRDSWFREPVDDFVRRWFKGRAEEIARPTTADSYDAIVTDLHDEVQQGIVTRDVRRNQLVVAGPGSGKTRILVRRVAWLLRVHRVRSREILVICYTRANAVELRRRLSKLVGDDARGVAIQTLHGVAMRILGRRRAGEQPLGTWIGDATRLLDGPDLSERERARQRDALLGGVNYLFIDEYQDLDESRYGLLTALTGRRLGEGDRKLRVFAVGDDDQAIFAHEGSKTEFIRKFEEEYNARRDVVPHSYRCPAALLDLAQGLLRPLPERLKEGRELVVDPARREEPPIGPWAAKHLRGRIPWTVAPSVSLAAARLIEGVRDWVGRGMEPSRVAVLARSRPHGLHRLRAAAEQSQIPFTWTFPGNETVAVYRIREMRSVGDALRNAEGDLSAAQIRRIVDELPTNHWSEALSRWLEPHRGRSQSSDRWWADLQKWMWLERGARTVGHGVHLSTMHSAKGLEFDHVFLLDDGRMADEEDERRLLYVALTRARQSVQIVSTDPPSPVFRALSHPLLELARANPAAATPPVDRSYALLGLGDIWIDWLGRQGPDHPGHRAMERAAVGDRFTLHAAGPWLSVVDGAGVVVARVAKERLGVWRRRLEQGLQLRLLAVLEERVSEGHREERYREQLQRERWFTGVWDAWWRGEPR